MKHLPMAPQMNQTSDRGFKTFFADSPVQVHKVNPVLWMYLQFVSDCERTRIEAMELKVNNNINKKALCEEVHTFTPTTTTTKPPCKRLLFCFIFLMNILQYFFHLHFFYIKSICPPVALLCVHLFINMIFFNYVYKCSEYLHISRYFTNASFMATIRAGIFASVCTWHLKEWKKDAVVACCSQVYQLGVPKGARQPLTLQVN